MSDFERRDESVAIEEIDYDGIDPHIFHNRWKTLAVLCTSLLIVIIGNTVLNVALPTLQKPVEQGGLGASNTQVQWIVDAYGLIFAGLLFTAAALGDRFGRKGALQAGLLVFAARLDPRRPVRHARDAHRGTGDHGHRRGVRHAVHAVDPDQRLPDP